MCEMESIIFTNLSKYKKLAEKKLSKIHEKYDLRKIDMEIIVYLANCGSENTARDIATTNMFTKGHISQSVKRLETMGYIKVEHDNKDMRIQHLILTEAVKPLLDELIQNRLETESLVFEGVSDKQLEVLKEVFQIMCDNIMREMKK